MCPQVIVRAPMALELRVKDTLAPRAAYLRATLCLNSGALGKLVTRHPQARALVPAAVMFLARAWAGGRQAGGSRGARECGAEPAHGAWGCCLPRAMRTGRRREPLPPPLRLWQPAG